MKKINFPFSAILGQDKMKMGLVLNVIDPAIGGILLTGHQGTGKSTAVRSLVELMPQIEVIK
ncbi:MAG: magnesium chelatase ATPase subunit I, partial [Candidatus Lokiarchaeota archaeon]|nr:magnesium chelatase ATPase subunit I [Candidatus Lokiarchaeota archaeon]